MASSSITPFQSEEDDDRYFGAGGPYQSLSSLEIKWRDRQTFLQSRGYMLRPRLRPGWTPSWLETGTYWRRSEDSAELPVSVMGHFVIVLILLVTGAAKVGRCH